MNIFDEREKAFENKFAHDEELAFRAKSRTHKLFAQWAAEQLGFDVHKAQDYMQEIVLLGMANRKDWSVNDKILHDLNSKGIEIARDTLMAHYATIHSEAVEQIMNEDEHKKIA